MRGKQMTGFPERKKAMDDFFQAWQVREKKEWISLYESRGRVLAEDTYSLHTLPIFPVAACDGIAVSARYFMSHRERVQDFVLGKDFVRADTGDDIPDGYDAVIPIEEIEFQEKKKIKYISEDFALLSGDNTRKRGSTINKGDLLVKKNTRIQPMDMAALAMGGVTMVLVYKKPVVAFIPTGSELILPGAEARRGENVDTNSILVKETIKEFGGEPVIFPIIKDRVKDLKKTIMDAIEQADVVIVNAGTAKGEEDFNFGILGEEGTLIHHYIAVAPGRPMALFVVKNKPVINLPGPTIATYFGMDWCVRGVINRILHLPMQKRRQIQGVLQADISTHPAMAILLRMEVKKDKDGKYLIFPKSFHVENQAEVLSSNALYISEIGEKGRKKGEEIQVELLREEMVEE